MATSRVTIRDHTKPLLAKIQRATARALNRAIVTVRVDVLKKLATETRVKQAVIRERLEIQRATPQRLEATCVVSAKPIPLIAFGAKQSKAGVMVAGGRLRRGVFIATMRSGHKGVFARRHPSLSRKGKPRSSPGLKIVEQAGPSLPAVATRQRILESALAVGEAAFQTRLKAELQHELGGT
jgi:minor tail protein Z (GPZ)